MKLTLNDQDIIGIIENGSLVIEDPLENPCRRLKFKLKRDSQKQVANFLGQTADLEVNGSAWFEGVLMHKGKDPFGRIEYTVNDPLFYLGKNPGDYIFQNKSGDQIIGALAEAADIKVGSLAATGVVFPQLLYRGKEAHTIALDAVARMVQEGKKFWFRFEPGTGLVLFERKVPTNVWVFEVGVNLSDAFFEESIENQITRVTLVNRETGEVITQEATEKLHPGNVTQFEEVDLKGPALAAAAASKLSKGSKIEKTMRINGFNPGVMPMFWSGDPVYIHEPGTGIAGGYYFKNVTQTVVNDKLVYIMADVIKALDMPEIQYQDATEAAKEKAARKKGDKVPDVIERYF